MPTASADVARAAWSAALHAYQTEVKLRYVRTPEGARKYGVPIGTPITRDVIDGFRRDRRQHMDPRVDLDAARARDLERRRASREAALQPVSPALANARARAQKKLEALPPIDPELVAKRTEEAARIARGELRSGGEHRGNSRDRRRSRANLFREFGGEDLGHVPCVHCGLPLHHEAGHDLPVLTRDKLRTFRDGGGYQLPNLVPACASCNASRGADEADFRGPPRPPRLVRGVPAFGSDGRFEADADVDIDTQRRATTKPQTGLLVERDVTAEGRVHRQRLVNGVPVEEPTEDMFPPSGEAPDPLAAVRRAAVADLPTPFVNAIAEYATENDVNAELRRGVPPDDLPDLEERLRVGRLSAAIGRQRPLDEPVTLYRGLIGVTPETHPQLFEDGGRFRDLGFLSATPDAATAADIAAEQGAGTVVRIDVPVGMRALSVRETADRGSITDEVILQRGVEYAVSRDGDEWVLTPLDNGLNPNVIGAPGGIEPLPDPPAPAEAAPIPADVPAALTDPKAAHKLLPKDVSHRIRKKKAAVKFYAQRRDGRSLEEATAEAEAYERDALAEALAALTDSDSDDSGTIPESFDAIFPRLELDDDVARTINGIIGPDGGGTFEHQDEDGEEADAWRDVPVTTLPATAGAVRSTQGGFRDGVAVDGRGTSPERPANVLRLPDGQLWMLDGHHRYAGDVAAGRDAHVRIATPEDFHLFGDDEDDETVYTLGEYAGLPKPAPAPAPKPKPKPKATKPPKPFDPVHPPSGRTSAHTDPLKRGGDGPIHGYRPGQLAYEWNHDDPPPTLVEILEQEPSKPRLSEMWTKGRDGQGAPLKGKYRQTHAVKVRIVDAKYDSYVGTERTYDIENLWPAEDSPPDLDPPFRLATPTLDDARANPPALRDLVFADELAHLETMLKKRRAVALDSAADSYEGYLTPDALELRRAKETGLRTIGAYLGFDAEETEAAAARLGEMIEAWRMVGGMFATREAMHDAMLALRAGEPADTVDKRAMLMQKVWSDATWRAKYGDDPDTRVKISRFVTGSYAAQFEAAWMLTQPRRNPDYEPGNGLPPLPPLADPADAVVAQFPLTSWTVTPAGVKSGWIGKDTASVELKTEVGMEETWLHVWSEERFRTRGLKAPGEFIVDDSRPLSLASIDLDIDHGNGSREADQERLAVAQVRYAERHPDLEPMAAARAAAAGFELGQWPELFQEILGLEDIEYAPYPPAVPRREYRAYRHRETGEYRTWLRANENEDDYELLHDVVVPDVAAERRLDRRAADARANGWTFEDLRPMRDLMQHWSNWAVDGEAAKRGLTQSYMEFKTPEEAQAHLDRQIEQGAEKTRDLVEGFERLGRDPVEVEAFLEAYVRERLDEQEAAPPMFGGFKPPKIKQEEEDAA